MENVLNFNSPHAGIKRELMLKLFIASLLFCTFCVVITAQAQGTRLDISNIEKLAAKASEVVEVSLDQKLLQLATRFLDTKDADEAAVKELISGLKEIHVRAFEFDKPGQYTKADIEPIRKQLTNGWQKIVGFRSGKEAANADIYVKYVGDKIQGLSIIASEPKELIIINIVGNIDLDKLSRLEGKLGIPALGLKPRKND